MKHKKSEMVSQKQNTPKIPQTMKNNLLKTLDQSQPRLKRKRKVNFCTMN